MGLHPVHRRSGTPSCALMELRLAMPAELDIIRAVDAFVWGVILVDFESLNGL
jgi:hypothetical protein